MAENSALQWQQIVYGKQNDIVPEQRWGHRMAVTNQNELVMFGGFGSSSSQGKYLNDTWTFDLTTYSWLKIETTGSIPEARSNYTIHYDSVNNQIIVFGGGSQNKVRFNTVCILDWTTRIWRNAVPSETEPSPWQRTYHSSEFIFPYLVVFGGESVSNLDLDDMWAFNVMTEEWKKLEFTENGVHPKRRRFHSSALLNGHFYVIGGCTQNYELLGDMYRVDLTALMQQAKFDGFVWERLITYNKLVERWGHSTDVFDGKIYCVGGRISSTLDNNDIYVYDPSASTLKGVLVNSERTPKPRRKHASAMIGNSLLVFGGYDGKYLKDFHYIRLRNEKKIAKADIDLISLDSMSEVHARIYQLESTLNYSLSITLTRNGQPLSAIASSKELFQTNPFFKNMAVYSKSSGILQIQLPSFCDQLTFRVMHLAALEKQLVISKLFRVDFFYKLLQSMEYFCLKDLTPTIEDYLISVTEEHNCLELLHCSICLSLPSLKTKAAETYLIMNEYPFNKYSLRQIQGLQQKRMSYNHHSPQDSNNLQKRASDSIVAKLDTFDAIYKVIKLDLQQTRMRENDSNFLEKASKKIKRFFYKREEQTKTELILDHKVRSSNHQSGCISTVIGFISGLCTRRQAEQEIN